MDMKQMAVAGLLVAASGTAMADITAVGEFTGDQTETFESFDVVNFGGIPIFEGAGLLVDTGSPVTLASISSIGPEGELTAYEGEHFGETAFASGLITLATAATDFGAFFGTTVPPGTVTVTFRDDGGNEVGVTTFQLSTGTDWAWQGWHSDVAFSEIEFVHSAQGTFPGDIGYDNMQVTYVPAPATVGMMAACGVLAARRRRK